MALVAALAAAMLFGPVGTVTAAPAAAVSHCRPASEWFRECRPEEVIEAMQMMPDDLEAQTSGAFALGYLVFDETTGAVNAEKRLAVLRGGGLTAVLRAMSRFPQDAGVLSHCSYALGFLVHGGVPSPESALAAVTAMKGAPEDAGVQSNGLFALGALALSNSHKIADHGGIEATVAAMRRFHDDAGLQSNGCFALGLLADSPYTRWRTVNAGGVSAVESALAAFEGEEKDVVVDACTQQCEAPVRAAPDLPQAAPKPTAVPGHGEAGPAAAEDAATVPGDVAACVEGPIHLQWTTNERTNKEGPTALAEDTAPVSTNNSA